MTPSHPWRGPGPGAVLLAATVGLGASLPAEARVTRVEIVSVQSPTFGGVSFGSAGQYEKLGGRVYGEVDPTDPRNAVIADIGLAPRNARGMVEYASLVTI